MGRLMHHVVPCWRRDRSGLPIFFLTVGARRKHRDSRRQHSQQGSHHLCHRSIHPHIKAMTAISELHQSCAYVKTLCEMSTWLSSWVGDRCGEIVTSSVSCRRADIALITSSSARCVLQNTFLLDAFAPQLSCVSTTSVFTIAATVFVQVCVAKSHSNDWCRMKYSALKK